MSKVIDLIKFPKSYKVVNKTKNYPNPVSDSDIALLEQMGATVIKDEATRTITILNDPKKRSRSPRHLKKQRFGKLFSF